ncbi:MAG: AmmeMemoRadiSam system protein B, partial [Thermoanaerobaculia bacterium]
MTLRRPAVAGSFYDAEAGQLERDVRSLLPDDARPEPAFGAIVPHAGYIYSGPVAGAVYARLQIPAAAIILCPNHTGRGAPAAVDLSDAWRTPLGDARVDRRLARRLMELAACLTEDGIAHAREHSLEVQLPFLQVLRPDVSFVPVCLGEPDL